MEPELIKILIALAVQTVLLAQINKVRIEAMASDVRDAKDTGVRAHRRIDSLLEGKAHKCP